MEHSRQTLSEITSNYNRSLNTNQYGYDKAETTEVRWLISMSRQDSGFGDMSNPVVKDLSFPRSPDQAVVSTSSAYDNKHSGRLVENIAPKHTSPRNKTLRQHNSQEATAKVSIQTQSPRSATTRRLSHRSITAASTFPSSNISSRKSSTTFNANKKYATNFRGLGAQPGRSLSEDALALHRRSVQLFPPSSNNNLDPAPPTLIANPRRHTSPTIVSVSPTSHRSRIASQHSIDRSSLELVPEGPRGPTQYENFVPAASIDWTHPSTRQRQYRKIDQSSRGLRGLWRRLAPRWCPGHHSHLDFFREDDVRSDDMASVRRYRLDSVVTGTGVETEPESVNTTTTMLETEPDSDPRTPAAAAAAASRLRRYLSFPSKRRTRTKNQALKQHQQQEQAQEQEQEPATSTSEEPSPSRRRRAFELQRHVIYVPSLLTPVGPDGIPVGGGGRGAGEGQGEGQEEGGGGGGGGESPP